MKKAVFLLSVLALAGCDEDDVKNTLNGKAEVFAVTSAEYQVGETSSFYDFETLETNYNVNFPENFLGGSRVTLENKLGSSGIVPDSSSCGIIDTSSGNACFGENGSGPCAPTDLKKLGLILFTIDLSDVEMAVDKGFYPKLAVELLGSTYSDFDIDDARCSDIGVTD